MLAAFWTQTHKTLLVLAVLIGFLGAPVTPNIPVVGGPAPAQAAKADEKAEEKAEKKKKKKKKKKNKKKNAKKKDADDKKKNKKKKKDND